MENVKWIIVRIVMINKWKQGDTLEPKWHEIWLFRFGRGMANGQTNSGLKMAPKASILSLIWNLVSPKCSHMGRISARNDDGIEGRGVSKKRMLICNWSDRGSNFASIRKDANCVPRKCNHATGIVVLV